MSRVWVALAFGFTATSILALSGFDEQFGNDALAAALLAIVGATLAIGGRQFERLDPARLRDRRRRS